MMSDKSKEAISKDRFKMKRSLLPEALVRHDMLLEPFSGTQKIYRKVFENGSYGKILFKFPVALVVASIGLIRWLEGCFFWPRKPIRKSTSMEKSIAQFGVWSNGVTRCCLHKHFAHKSTRLRII